MNTAGTHTVIHGSTSEGIYLPVTMNVSFCFPLMCKCLGATEPLWDYLYLYNIWQVYKKHDKSIIIDVSTGC